MTMGFGFCPKCGTPRVAAEQRFCAGCGGALSPVAPPAPQIPEPIAPSVPASNQWTSPTLPLPASEPVLPAEVPAAPPPWAAQQATPPAEAVSAPPVAPPAWPMPPAAAPTAPPSWAMPPAAPGAPAAQTAPPVYPGAPAPYYPSALAPAPVPRAPGTPIATVAGIKITPKLLAIGVIALAVVVAIVYVMTMGSKSAGISVTPSSFSCSSSIQVQSAIKLPSSLLATDTIVLTVDGVAQRTTTVGAYMNKQGDGSWTRESVASANSACQGVNGQLSAGTHTVRILDVGGRVIAEGSFTLTP